MPAPAPRTHSTSRMPSDGTASGSNATDTTNPTTTGGTNPPGGTNPSNDMTSRMSQSAQPTQPQLAPGVSITSREPLVFRYRSADYAVGDTGEWVRMNTNRPVSQTLSRFFDSQEDIISRTAASGPSRRSWRETSLPVRHSRASPVSCGTSASTGRACRSLPAPGSATEVRSVGKSTPRPVWRRGS